MVTDNLGVIKNESDYYPYGGERPIMSADSNRYKFTGKERDAESNLDEFGARYYASAIGRFMTPDWAARPIAVPYAVFGDPQSLNLYSYVRNDPVTRADADGHGDAQVILDRYNKMSPQEKYSAIPYVKGAAELSSAVATGGATVEALEAGAALKTLLGAMTTTGLAVSGSSQIIGTASGVPSEGQ